MSAGLRSSLSWPLLGGGKTSHFDQLCSTEQLFATWDKFARGKHGKADVQSFKRQLEKNIFELQAELLADEYQHGKYEPFIVHDPKRRQIHKADVRDRVVHQAVFDVTEPFFEKQFIFDSFSCRKGKGTHAGVRRLRQHLSRASRNNSRPVFALKCDVKQFFANVEHAKLLNLLSISVTDEKVLELLEGIINSFYISPGQGIPLGNVTSQLFANVYMHQLDWFVKHNLHEEHYIRYCDDFVIISSSRQHLLDLITPIEEFLAAELNLKLHPSKVVIRSWIQGIDFLGYIIKPHCTLLRTKTKHRILMRADSKSISSYLGVLSHADSYELRQILLSKL